MRNSLFLALVFLLTPVALIAASPIQNLIDVPVPIRVDGGGYSIEEVRAAIIKASQTGLWTAEIAADNAIRAHLNVKNKHFAVVEIPYSETAYSIMYVSSDNLDYNAKWQSIHRNYNKWVLQLSTSIKEQFQALEASDVPNVSACDEPNMNNESIFDELLKLDDLRDQGILTDEEFEAEKRKLLKRN